MRTVAIKDGDYYTINGAKNFITHGKSGDVAVVIVRTGPVGDSHGMTAFIIEKGTPGFSAGKKENKLGMRASETAELIFTDCRVHKSQVIGKEPNFHDALHRVRALLQADQDILRLSDADLPVVQSRCRGVQGPCLTIQRQGIGVRSNLGSERSLKRLATPPSVRRVRR